MPLNIALINPFNSYLTDNKEMADLYWNSPQLALVRFYRTGPVLGLLTIAGIEDRDINYRYIDERYEPVEYKKYDIVCMSLMALQANRSYEMAAEFKKRGAYIVMGGLHTTILPDEVKEHCDTIFIGEAELTWPRFIEDFKRGEPKKCYKNEKLIDMTKSPSPKYELISHMTSYYLDVPIQISRGCPHDCAFCTASKMYGFDFRQKTVKQVLNELERVLAIYKKKPSIWFTDDNMCANKDFAKQLLPALIPYKILWHTQTDLSIAEDDELLKLLAKAGGKRILIGLESVIQENLKEIEGRGWKSRTPQEYLDAIEKIQSFGVGVVGAFMVGLEYDTKETFQKTIDFIKKSKLYGVQVTVLTPMPGTRVYNTYKAEGRLLHEDWSRYTYQSVNFIHKNLTKEEIEDGVEQIYKAIYNKEFFKEKAMYFKEVMSKKHSSA